MIPVLLALFLATLPCFLITCGGQASAMQLDPARIAARLRIEEEAAKSPGRNRRQLIGTPKEETIQVTAQLFSGRLFEYGAGVGDQKLAVSLDAVKKFQLTQPISYYGREYSIVYILANGGVGFDSGSKNYRPGVLPGNVKLIAPFWNRNDLRNGGEVFYREVRSGRAFDRGQSEIRYQYDKEVQVQSALIITWEKMQPLGADALPDENTNTFQAAIFSTSNGTYANFVYNNIGWTQGAEAGFSSGDGTRHYALPTSGTGNIMHLEEAGNTGIPGEWMFELGMDRVARCKAGIKGDTCDEVCGAGEWGPDCAGCCHCAEGHPCNNVTGECGTLSRTRQSSSSSCAPCWSGHNCQQKLEECGGTGIAPRKCAHNAVAYTDYDRCGEPIQRCECLVGYEGNGDEECRDVDECRTQRGICHEKAICTNTPGRYFCQCVGGFSGDGVTECIASFLYPTGGEPLQRARNSRAVWELKFPLKIFGQLREKLIVSSDGLITLKETAKLNPGEHLDDMGVLGIAPFFAPIDITQSGEVNVAETTDSTVLTRATQLINENLDSSRGSTHGDDSIGFTATSVLIISFINVSTTRSRQATNTFQTLLIGGLNSKREPLTFTKFLYKELSWSEQAEAGILLLEKSSSIHLPGSGTSGIEQLSQLSNVRSPGIWLYRIDGEMVQPCMRPELQPPYCDVQSQTAITHRNPITAVTQPTSMGRDLMEWTTPKSAKKDKKPELAFHSDPNVATATIPHPNLTSVLPSGGAGGRTVQWPKAFASTPASRLAVSGSKISPVGILGSGEVEELPPDAFDVTFPSSITVIPQLLTTMPQRGSSENSVISTIVPELIRPSSSVTAAGSKVLLSTGKQKTDQPPQAQLPPRLAVDEESSAATTSSKKAEDLATAIPVIKPIGQGKVPSGPLSGNTSAVISTATLRPGKARAGIQTKTTTPSSKKAKNEQAEHGDKGVGKGVDGADSIPYDPNRILNPEAAEGKFGIIIPVAIVLVWLLILIIVAVFLCCQRRRSQVTLRTMYGPAYQIRPMSSTYGGSSKPYDSPYEDHLEKAARIGADMNAYHSGGRYSLYGSYWNLSSSESSPREAARGQPGGLHRTNALTTPGSQLVNGAQLRSNIQNVVPTQEREAHEGRNGCH